MRILNTRKNSKQMKRYLIEYEIQLDLNFKKKINNNIVKVYLIELHSQL